MRLGKKLLIVLSVAFAALLLSSGAGAGAQEGTSGAYVGNEPPPEVLNNSLSPAGPSTEVAGTSVENSSLAFTGGDATGIALIGGTAVLVGAALVLARRRTAVDAA